MNTMEALASTLGAFGLVLFVFVLTLIAFVEIVAVDSCGIALLPPMGEKEWHPFYPRRYWHFLEWRCFIVFSVATAAILANDFVYSNPILLLVSVLSIVLALKDREGVSLYSYRRIFRWHSWDWLSRIALVTAWVLFTDTSVGVLAGDYDPAVKALSCAILYTTVPLSLVWFGRNLRLRAEKHSRRNRIAVAATNILAQ